MSIIKSEIIPNFELICIMNSNGKFRSESLETVELLKVTIIGDIKQSSIRRKVNFNLWITDGIPNSTGTGYLLMDSLVLQYNKKYYKAKKIIISSDKHIKL